MISSENRKSTFPDHALNDILLTAKQLKPLTRHAYLNAGAPDSVAGEPSSDL